MRKTKAEEGRRSMVEGSGVYIVGTKFGQEDLVWLQQIQRWWRQLRGSARMVRLWYGGLARNFMI